MTSHKVHTLLNYIIASVWLINGLFCKVLNLTPRHKQIVAQIIGHDIAKMMTIFIGFSEIVMAIWIWTQYKSKLSATLQIAIVVIMNLLEFILVPDLLLWGRFNAVFALLFIGLVYFNTFIFGERAKLETEL